MTEDGLSEFESIRSSESESNARRTSVGGEVGVSNVFAFLGLSLKGSRAKSLETSGQREVSREKVYTPNALFAKLREVLYEDKRIVEDVVSGIEPGTFVEFNCTLRKNPLIDALEGFKSLIDLFGTFQRVVPNQFSTQSGATKATAKSTAASLADVKKLVDGLLVQLNAEGTIDLIGDAKDEQQSHVVLAIDRAFAYDPTLADLLDGEYTVLGKVTRVIASGSSDRISLLRKTSFGLISESMMADFVAAFGQMSSSGIMVPKIITHIDAPAVQIIPVAIFS